MADIGCLILLELRALIKDVTRADYERLVVSACDHSNQVGCEGAFTTVTVSNYRSSFEIKITSNNDIITIDNCRMSHGYLRRNLTTTVYNLVNPNSTIKAMLETIMGLIRTNWVRDADLECHKTETTYIRS